MIGWLEVPAARPDAELRRIAAAWRLRARCGPVRILHFGYGRTRTTRTTRTAPNRDVTIDRIDLQPLASHTAAGARIAAITEHQLARAIAMGRHAVERARLAGIRICILQDGAAGHRGGALRIAALAGACLAGAQIGLPLVPLAPSGRIAARLACRFDPGCAPWLITTSANGYFSSKPASRYSRRASSGSRSTP